MRIRVLVRLLAVTAIVFGAGTAVSVDAAVSTSAATSAAAVWDASTWSPDTLGDINPTVFAAALDAAESAIAQGKAADPATLTVIDFTRPSTQRRMWVYDLRSRALLFDEMVSHGRGSGLAMATAFSNAEESHMSSLGLYRTGEAYVGRNGYSLRLDGLDPGLNDNARARAIVVHGAPYVNAAMAKVNGYLGRSYGCPAVRAEIARPLIDTIKGGGLLFAYGTPAVARKN